MNAHLIKICLFSSIILFLFFGLHLKNKPQDDLVSTYSDVDTPNQPVSIPSKQLNSPPEQTLFETKAQKNKSAMFNFSYTTLFLFMCVLIFAGNNFFLRRDLKKSRDSLQKLKYQIDNLDHELIETNQDLDTFLYKASHDLKGPISTLDGLCNVGILDTKNMPAEQYFELQKEVIHKMQLLLFRLVEIGDIRNHKVKPSKVRLMRFCKSIVRSMNRVEGFDKINFTIDIPKDLIIHTDVEMLEIAVDNVIKNAIQHANYSNKNNASVSISLKDQAQILELHIIDNGQGIPQKLVGRIFEMFFRGNSYVQGFGLGLYKSKVATKKLNGEVKLLKSDEKGSVFSVIIPKLSPTI